MEYLSNNQLCNIVLGISTGYPISMTSIQC